MKTATPWRFCEAAEFALSSLAAPPSVQPPSAPTPAPVSDESTYFADGRYQVQKFLVEGGKKRAYLADDTTLNREVARGAGESRGPRQ